MNRRWAELLPAGPDITARDGRRWTFDAAEVVASFRANQGPLAVDYEHAQDLTATKGEQAPAAGWIVDLRPSATGAINALIEWTSRAAAMIDRKEYRYLSPSMRLASGSRRIIGLNGAGLVNRPAMYLQPLDAALQEANDVTIEAIALAARAQVFQGEMLALGHHISIGHAITMLVEGSADEHLPKQRNPER